MRRFMSAASLAVILGAGGFTGAAYARPFPDVIVLPGATSAEGIATGIGSTFFAGDLFAGNIYRGDLRSGSVSMFIHAPAGRMAIGMKVDVRHNLLFVAGGFGGQAYVYNADTGAQIAAPQLANPAGGTAINDVTITNNAAWFTDSFNPKLYRVPIGRDGSIGTPSTLVLTGPAAHHTGGFDLNGIAATADGKTLIVGHTGDATLYTVDPATGASAPIAGANLPSVDGILLEDGRLWAVQNYTSQTKGQVTELKLSADLSSATVVNVLRSPNFEGPTTVARDGERLALVNGHFDTGLPPTAPTYEVVVVDR